MYLHASLVVILPDMLEDGVETLERGGRQTLLAELVVENVQLVTHILQLPSHLWMSSNCEEKIMLISK